MDRYGDGGVVADLEAAVAEMLGQPAAVFLPSGTMAQQSALRVHADRRGRRTVALPPRCHLDRHEGRALRAAAGARRAARSATATGCSSSSDLTAVAEPPAALLIELPQRDLGGQLPAWDDLQAQTAWARERGAAAHLDGARLWEAAAGYDRPPAEIAALFDTIYVSASTRASARCPAAALAGPEDVVAEVREWRGRMGGTLFGLWPGAASALDLPAAPAAAMPAYLERARAIADAVRDLPGVTVVPDPPQTPMIHLLLRTSAESFAAAARTLAADSGLWTWEKPMTTGDPAVQRVEFSVGDATMALPVDDDPRRDRVPEQLAARTAPASARSPSSAVPVTPSIVRTVAGRRSHRPSADASTIRTANQTTVIAPCTPASSSPTARASSCGGMNCGSSAT